LILGLFNDLSTAHVMFYEMMGHWNDELGNMERPCQKLKQLVGGFPLRRPEFDPGHLEFVVDKVAL
jgi:hypothetical protein